MLENLRAVKPTALLFVKHLNKQVLAFVGNRLPLRLVEVQVPIQDIILGLFFILADKRHASSKHRV
jgi:hypothetical protein